LYPIVPLPANYDLSSTQSITGATAYGQNITTVTTGTYIIKLPPTLLHWNDQSAGADFAVVLAAE